MQVTAIERETAKGFDLQAKMEKTEEINGVKYLSIDAMSFEKVEKAAKPEVMKSAFTDSIVKEKSFLGYKINDLYSFFMLFVFMAGIASVILFFLSRMLLKMMNGIR